MRKEFDVTIKFNHKHLHPLIIDSHFMDSHPNMTFEIIVELVKTLDGGIFEAQEEKDAWSYYAIEPTFYHGKPYRIILVTHREENYLGVINAFRVKRRKKYES